MQNKKYTLSDIKNTDDAATSRHEKLTQWSDSAIYRPISRPISLLFIKAGISANGTTLIGAILTVSLPFMALTDGPFDMLWVAIAAGLVMILDCVDGAIARVTNTTSQRGQYFDFLSDTVYRLMMYLAVGILAWKHGDGWISEHAFVLSVTAAWICTAARLLRDYAKNISDGHITDIFPEKDTTYNWLDYVVFAFSSLDHFLPFIVLICAVTGMLPFLVAWLFIYAVIEFAYSQYSAWHKLT